VKPKPDKNQKKKIKKKKKRVETERGFWGSRTTDNCEAIETDLN
jgi:hypothetical protein